MSPVRYSLSLLFVLIVGFKLGQLVFDKNTGISEETDNITSVHSILQLEQSREYTEKNNGVMTPIQENKCLCSFEENNSVNIDDEIVKSSVLPYSMPKNIQSDTLHFLQNALHSTSNENTLRMLDELAIVEDSVLFDKSIDYLQSQNASEQEVALTLLAKAIDNNNQSAIQSTMASAYNLLTIETDSEEEAAKLMRLFTQAAIISDDDTHKEQSHSLLLRHSYSDSLYIKIQAAKGLVALAPDNPATLNRMYALLTESFTVEEKIASLNVLTNSSVVNESILAYLSQLAESPNEPIAVRTRAMALLNKRSNGSLSVQSY